MSIHGFNGARPDALDVHALVAEIVLEFDCLEMLHRVPCLQKKVLLTLRISGGLGLPQKQVRQLEEERPVGLAKRHARGGVPEAERNITADGLQCLDRPTIRRDSRFDIAPRFQQPARLPFPTIQGLRGLRLLGSESCAAGECQSRLGLRILFVKLSQIPERIGFYGTIANLFSNLQSLLEGLVSP